MVETIVRNLTVSRIMYIIKKRILIAVLMGFIGAGLAGVYAEYTSSVVYRASVAFYLYSRTDYTQESDVYVSSSDFSYAKNLIKSYTLILRSDAVMQRVIDETGLSYSPSALAKKITYSEIADTSVFYIFVSDSDPYTAMNIANSIAEVAPEEISRIVKSGGISVISYATLPTSPASETNIIKYILIGTAAGFAIPMVLFLFFGLIDSTIRSKSELLSEFDIPIIGEIPEITTGSKKQKGSKIIQEETPFAITESYNSLCANLLFTTKGEKCPVYAVTSSIQNEGKSISSINIAKTLAALGRNTLLIDGDLRNSSVGFYMNNDEEYGLSQYLATMGNEKIVAIEDNLSVLFSGKRPPNPSELLASPRMEELIAEMKKKFDFVIIDLPPLGIVADAMLIKDYILGYIVVVKAGFSKAPNVAEIVDKFEKTGANVSGIVLNCVNAKSGNRGYGYYGNYDYNNK